ncbi:Hypothetical predicted protein, partial [Mytilus galloprovincialis]
HDHSLVVKLRWLSGASATILCYPVLMHLGISSHFLPWLPAAIGTYSVFGAVLSYKKTKRISDGVLAVAIIFSVLWGSLLPWKLAYPFSRNIVQHFVSRLTLVSFLGDM